MKYDDFEIGQTYETAQYLFTKADIMAFASEYDPQYMHLDEAKAAQGRFGGIIASGMQTMAVAFKLWVQLGMYGDEVVAGTGMNNVRFIRPVYPGNRIRTKAEVIGKTDKNSDNGIVTVLLTAVNEKDERVFTAELSALIRK
ncbi:MaoC family dehydratase [Paenibacillus protaetiae]|uniref:MaoC family dehydratase n=1 Tax=Paenibacillus protaetiae TaxID=2509456 RepID=A0A4P6FDD3_9BACL|nr:MaoC family dehydratase [Paenibacillus protaetiae]QAY68588.1 MaoC family dehydratase [Paenibacillus protaetiae]